MTVKFSPHPQVTCKEVGERYFLIAYGPARDTLPYLREINETGSFFWELLEEGCDRDAMLERALEIYDAPRTTLENGLMAFLDDLTGRGYVIREEMQLRN